MQTVFHLNASELDVNFLEALKTLFRDSDIAITVETVSNGHSDNDEDETDFLMQNPANQAMLETSMREADEGKLITVDMEKILAGFHPSESIISSYKTSSVH
jgi:hypothetical protein